MIRWAIDTVVAGGMESMTQAPYLLQKARLGARMGNGEMVDAMIHDGLWSTFTGQHMGESSDEVNASWAFPGGSGRLGGALTPTGGCRPRIRALR